MALLAVLAVAVPSAGVTAAVTSGSTIAGNRFGATDRVDVGVHDLTVVPAGGRAGFRPGEAGTVSLRMTPVGRDTVAADLRPGDTLTFATTLPAWLEPGTLPGTSTFPNGRVEWQASQDPDGGSWTVTRTSRFTGTQAEFAAPARLSFPVVARGVLTGGDVVASVSTPEHLASTAPSTSVPVAGTSHVDIGVHDLVVTPTDDQRFTEGTEGRVTFRLTPAPSATPRPTDLRAGEVLVHEFTTPAWLTPTDLPSHLPNERTTTTWASAQNPDGTWTVRRTQEFHVDWTEYHAIDLGFGVRATGTPVEGDSVRATTTLPGGLVSNHGTDQVDALAAHRVDVGAYGLTVTPATGSAFQPGMPGTARFTATPSGAAAALRLDAGDAVRHSLTLPAGLAPGTLPADTATVTWGSAPLPDGATVVTRTQTFASAATQYPATTITVPVVATATPSVTPGAVTAAAVLPSHSTSTAPRATAFATFTTDTSLGVYDLSVAPDSGTGFAAGSTGTVSFLSTPDTAVWAALPVQPGAQLSYEVTLPRGLTPGAMPAPGRWATSYSDWTTVQNGDGTWTLTFLEVFTAARTSYNAGTLLRFPVTADGTLTDGAAVTVRVTPPAPLTSTSPEATTPVALAPRTDVGVHALTLTPEYGTTFLPWMPGTLTFRTTPSGAPVTAALDAGSTVVHTLTLPAWLAPVTLPEVSTSAVSTVQWSQTTTSTTRTITRSETFLAARTTHPGGSVSLPVRAAADPGTASAQATVTVEIHRAALTSSSASAEVRADVTDRTDVGVHALTVTPSDGSGQFNPGTAGTVSFQSNPVPTQWLPMTALPGQEVTYSITLPGWLEPGTLPRGETWPTSVTSWTRSTTGSTWTVTFRDAFTADRTWYDAGVLSFPVTATGVPVDQDEVTVAATVPPHLTSTSPSATAVVTASAAIPDGVYGLTVTSGSGSDTFRPGETGTLRFAPHSSAAARAGAPTYLAGDVLTYEVALPLWLTPTLPSGSDDATSTVTWAAVPRSDENVIRRTEKFKKSSKASGAVPTWTVAVKAGDPLTDRDVAARVTVTLPRQLPSEQPSMSRTVRARAEAHPFGVYQFGRLNTSFQFQGSQFFYSSTPYDAPITALLRQGDVITEKITTAMVASEIQSYPTNTDDANFRITWTRVASNQLTRTITVKRDVTGVSIPQAWFTAKGDHMRVGTWSTNVQVSSTWPARLGRLAAPHGSIYIEWRN
jgi:hypothetical protein